MFAELILQRLDMLRASLHRRSQALVTNARFVPVALPLVYRPAR